MSEGREFICVRWKVIHVRQEESNTNLLAGVSEGRGHRCVKRNGTQVCNEEGNTCVSTGRENRSVREKKPIVIDTLSPIILRNWSLEKDIRIQVFIIGTSSFPI